VIYREPQEEVTEHCKVVNRLIFGGKCCTNVWPTVNDHRRKDI